MPRLQLENKSVLYLFTPLHSNNRAKCHATLLKTCHILEKWWKRISQSCDSNVILIVMESKEQLGEEIRQKLAEIEVVAAALQQREEDLEDEINDIFSGSASKSSIQRLVITEKAPTRAFSWLKAATTAFTFKIIASRTQFHVERLWVNARLAVVAAFN